MKTTKIIQRIQKLDVDYKAKLKAFFDEYFKMMSLVEEKISIQKEESDCMYTVQKLKDWMDCFGEDLLYSTIDTLQNDVSDKMNRFIEYYSFLLLSSMEDEYSLIDQLFAIPGQFAKEFAKKKEALVIEDWDVSDEYHKAIEPRYVFCTTGIFLKVPCFI